MKSIILAGASALAMMAAAPALAQQVTPGATPTPTDAPGYFTGLPTSTAANEAQIVQQAADNDATVKQTGAASFARVEQGSANANSGGNRADVDQSGAGANNALVKQVATNRRSSFPNADDVPINGGTNPDLAFDLDGSVQRATITQSNTSAGSDANNAVILQGANGVPGFLNQAEIDQSGTGNDAAIQQGGGSNAEDGRMLAATIQNGDGNIADLRQGESDFSYIDQDGSTNQAYVDQDYVSGVTQRSSEVWQEGSNQLATVNQKTSLVDSIVDQGNGPLDSNNDATVNQNIGSIGSTSWIVQNGSDSKSSVTQSGAGNTAYAEQGDDSAFTESMITQSGNGSLAYVYQDGESDELDAQTSDVTQSGQGSAVFVAQIGASNDSEVTQSAFISAVGVAQVGDSNTADITQSGTFNLAGIAQADVDLEEIMDGDFSSINAPGDASGNTAEIKQAGSLNLAGSLQTGSNNIRSYIEQGEGSSDNTALALQEGDFNTSDITQLENSSGNWATVSQYGEGDVSTVTQGGSNHSATVTQGGFALPAG